MANAPVSSNMGGLGRQKSMSGMTPLAGALVDKTAQVAKADKVKAVKAKVKVSIKKK